MPIFSDGKVLVLHFYFDSNKIGTLKRNFYRLNRFTDKDLAPESTWLLSMQNDHVK